MRLRTDRLHKRSLVRLIVFVLIISPFVRAEDNNPKNKTRVACVTGGTGCVGRNIVEELLGGNEPWEVVVLHRKSSDLSRLDGCNVRFQEVDLHDLSSVRAAIPQGADVIFHAAGNTSHWRKEELSQWKDNVLATDNLARVALEHGVGRFIFTSTGATLPYQWNSAEQVSEIRNNYVRTKREAELRLYEYAAQGLDIVILHPIIVVGEFDYNSYSQLFTALKTAPIKFAFPGSIMFCHARDVARAHVAAYFKGCSCERYVLGGPHHTWKEFSEQVLALVAPGSESSVHVLPRWLLKIMAYGAASLSYFTGRKPFISPDLVDLLRDAPDLQVYDRLKAQLLGYESSSLNAMVSDCYRWLTRLGKL